MKALKIILYIILFAAFATSWYFSYLYIKKITLQPISADVQNQMNMPQEAIFGKIIAINKEKITVEKPDDQSKMEIKLSDNTLYQKSNFGVNEISEAKFEDMKEGYEASVYYINTDKNTKEALNVQIIIPEE